MVVAKVVPPELSTRPFTVAEATRLGVSRQTLRGRRFRRPFRGVLVPAGLPDSLETRADAARLVLPETAAFSHHTAALLRGLPLDFEGPLHVTVPIGGRRSIQGIVCHEAATVGVQEVNGRPLVTPERTIAELAAYLPVVSLVVVGDALVRHGWTTVEDLTRAADKAKGRPGGPVAAAAARFVRPRVDSPMETRTRMLVVLAGLPCPEPGLDVLDDRRRWVATVDMQYPVQKIVIEYDGDLHRTERTKWRNDVAKRERLRELGWIVLVVTGDDIAVRPWDVLRRVQRALIERRHPDVGHELSPAWRAHFQVRRRPRVEPWAEEDEEREDKTRLAPERVPPALRWLD